MRFVRRVEGLLSGVTVLARIDLVGTEPAQSVGLGRSRCRFQDELVG
jgi:hypothetical protein